MTMWNGEDGIIVNDDDNAIGDDGEMIVVLNYW